MVMDVTDTKVGRRESVSFKINAQVQKKKSSKVVVIEERTIVTNWQLVL